MQAVASMAEGIRQPSLNRAVAYRDQQEEERKAAVYKATEDEVIALWADPGAGMQEKQAALTKQIANLRLLSGQRVETGKDGVMRWAGGNEGEAKVKINQLVKTLHGEHVQSLMYASKYAEAEKFTRAHIGQLTLRQRAMFTQAANAKSADLPPATPETKTALENSKFLQTVEALAGGMYASNEVREQAVATREAFANYARLGGDIAEFEKNFLLVNDGNMRIIAPKSLALPGLDTKLEQTLENWRAKLKPGDTQTSKQDYINAQAVFQNGFWAFDGTDGFVFMDAATGSVIRDVHGGFLRVNLEDLKHMPDTVHSLEHYYVSDPATD
jgi:hypothetical protein